MKIRTQRVDGSAGRELLMSPRSVYPAQHRRRLDLGRVLGVLCLLMLAFLPANVALADDPPAPDRVLLQSGTETAHVIILALTLADQQTVKNALIAAFNGSSHMREAVFAASVRAGDDHADVVIHVRRDNKDIIIGAGYPKNEIAIDLGDLASVQSNLLGGTASQRAVVASGMLTEVLAHEFLGLEYFPWHQHSLTIIPGSNAVLVDLGIGYQRGDDSCAVDFPNTPPDAEKTNVLHFDVAGAAMDLEIPGGVNGYAEPEAACSPAGVPAVSSIGLTILLVIFALGGVVALRSRERCPGTTA